MSLTIQQEKALELLALLEKREELYSNVNKTIKDLQKDFAGLLNVLDCELYDPVIALCDAVLGEQLASYYWWECRNRVGGRAGCIEINGEQWRISSLQDVRAFMLRDE